MLDPLFEIMPTSRYKRGIKLVRRIEINDLIPSLKHKSSLLAVT